MMNPHSARLLTLGLAGACGLLLLVAAAQQMGAGRGYHWAPDAAPTPDNLPSAASIRRDVASLGPETDYQETRNRPLFNEDRKPTPPEDAAVADEHPPVVPLNVTLTGVIITPQVKLAMLKDNAKGDAHSLHEGMPLPGDQAAWTVIEIQPRKVVLRSDSNETNELPLDVSAVTPAATTPRANPHTSPPPPPPGAPPVAMDPNANPAVNDRAAELQRRIEERRREMREQAERLRQQQQGNAQKQESE
jgi:general secretion pathway protein N